MSAGMLSDHLKFHELLISRISIDARLGPFHQSLFIALFLHWLVSGSNDWFPISRKKLMQASKIRSVATYHKCLKELIAFGYIIYQPSNHPRRGSMVSWAK